MMRLISCHCGANITQNVTYWPVFDSQVDGWSFSYMYQNWFSDFLRSVVMRSKNHPDNQPGVSCCLGYLHNTCIHYSPGMTIIDILGANY
jgi:hypothetical protein